MNIAHQGLLQVKGAVEALGLQHVADAAVEALNHAVGLGRLWWCQAVFDAQFGAEQIELLWLPPVMQEVFDPFGV